MIVVGYQGIGKSTLAGKDGCIDLESSNFRVDGIRYDDWYKYYCQIANHLSQQGYTVFVSSHDVVRYELKKYDEAVVVIYPSLRLRDSWVDKLRTRYKQTDLEKDYRAYMNAEDRYFSNIEELRDSGFETYEITDMSYNLGDIIRELRESEE